MKDIAEKIERFLTGIGKVEPGTVTHINVTHEDGCPAILTQRLTDCTCTPTIERMSKG
jgi:hypothetical protein